MKKSGAPIEWVKTADPVFVTLAPVAVAAKARNPNAAKLLMDFVLSREAQTRCCETPTDHPDGWMSNLWCRRCIPGKLKIAAIDPTVGEQLSKYSKEFREIYFR